MPWAILAIHLASVAHADDAHLEEWGMSLKEWQAHLWYRVADRAGNLNHPDEIGFLSRFNPEEDSEYQLDKRSYGFDRWQDFQWRQRRDGLRFWG